MKDFHSDGGVALLICSPIRFNRPEVCGIFS